MQYIGENINGVCEQATFRHCLKKKEKLTGQDVFSTLNIFFLFQTTNLLLYFLFSWCCMKRFCCTLFLCFYILCAVPETCSLLYAQTWVNGQPATLVIGQTDFLGSGVNFGGTMQGISFPDGVVAGNNKLFVSDRANHRVLRYALPLTGNYPTPEIVFGQSTSTGNTPNNGGTVNSIGFDTPIGLAYNAGTDELWVVDHNNNRVLRFAGAAAVAANGPTANLVLGQANFTANGLSISINGLNRPHSIALDIPNNKVYVADLLSHRVLRYDATMLSNGMNAECVFGQPDYISGGSGLGVNSFNAPSSITVDASGNLYVSDNGNNRIVRFNTAHTATVPTSVNGVLGQASFLTNGAGLSANQLNGPGGLSMNGTNLYVCDEQNRRILRFANADVVVTGMPNANLVLGQQNFVLNTPGVQRSICTNPRYVFYDGATNRMYVTEGPAVNRVLVFDADLPTLNSILPNLSANTGTLGQSITPTFSQNMNLLNINNFFAFGGMTGLKGGAFGNGGMTNPNFTPSVVFRNGEVVEYTLTTGATVGNGVSQTGNNKPYLNNFRPLAPATPFVGSFRTITAAPAGGVNFVLSTYANIGGDALAIIPADFDGDGYMDFAAASNTAGRIAVRRNLNVGNFANTATAGQFLDIGVAGILDLKIADMDHDGKPDWVYIDNGNLYFRRNTSVPGTISEIGFATGITVTGGQRITTGDFDGDGDIDVALIRTGPNELQIYRNNFPTLSLSLHSTTPLTGTPQSIASGDFNDDGSLDIVIGYSGTNNFLTYRNDGGGNMFQTLININTVGTPNQIIVGDLDGALGTDITVIVANAGTGSSVRRYRNNGAAGFPADANTIIDIPNFASVPAGFAIGDIDGANGLDIIAVNPQATAPSYATWFTNNGGGTFTPPTRSSVRFPDANARAVTLADLDGDGDLDALVGFGTGAAFPYVAVLRNEQQPTPTGFTPPINAENVNRVSATIGHTFSTNMTTGTATLVNFITPAPLQGGPIRIFGSMSGGRNRVGAGGSWSGGGTATIGFTPTNLLGASAANRFHPGELIHTSLPVFSTNAIKSTLFVPLTSGTATNLGGHVRIARANVGTTGPGLFRETQRITVGTNPRSVATADFNNDGRLDLCVVREAAPTGFDIILGGAGGVFGAPTTTALAGITGEVVVADFNNDGNMDIAMAGNGVNVLLGTGTGTFGAPSNYPVAIGGPQYGLTAADFNGDGSLDLVVASAGAGSVAMIPNNGAGNFGGTITYSPSAGITNALSLAAGDIDRDGDIDVVVALGFGTGQVRVLRNNGLGAFSNVTTITAANAYDVDLGDFNGDGWIDLAVVRAEPSNLLEIYMNSAGTIPTTPTSTTALGGANGPRSVVIGNFNNDAVLDIIVTNELSNNITVLTGDNAGNFALFSNASTDVAPRSWSVAGDFDNDGDLDFAVTNWGSNSVSILLNAKPPRINPLVPPGNAASYQREVQPQRNSHTQAFGTFPVRVRFDQPVTSATASFPISLPPSSNRGAIRIHGSMTGHRSTFGTVTDTWNYIAGTNTAEFIPSANRPFRAGETVMVTVTNAQGSLAGNQVFSTSPTVYSFTVAPSGGVGRFVDSRRYDDAGSSQCVVLADFDGNGQMDMMQGSANGLNLRLQNNPLGNPTSFANPVNIAAGNILHAVAADFDSDGRPDIAYISGTNIVVHRNNPLGAFGTILATIPSGTTGLNKLAVADFDGDGDMDIALAATSIRVFLNNGSATTFTLATNIAFVANSIAVLDADMDGDMDLAITNPPSTLIYLNQGSAPNLFPTTADFTLATAGAQEFAVGDFNGDTYPDLAVGESNMNNLYVLLNQANGTGSFLAATAYNTGSKNSIPVVGLFDGDNNLDIAVLKPNNADSKVLFYKGNGGGGFVLEHSAAFMESTNTPFNALFHPQAADMDGDGDLDIIVPLLNGNRTAILYNHQPELKVSSTIPPANANAVMQPVTITTTFNQNVTTGTAQFPNNAPAQGPLRIYGGMTGGRSRIAGGGMWAVPPMPPTPFNNPSFLPNNIPIIGQTFFPGEKVEFIASTNARIQGPPGVANTVPMTTGTVRQFWTRAGIGPATFFQHYLSPISRPANASFVQAADFNNDGRIDFITSENNTTLRVYLGNGNGTFTVGGTITGAFGTPADGRVVLADMDNDGIIDVINTDALGSNQIRIFKGDGAGGFPSQMPGSPINTSFAGVRGVAVGDVNGDGALDISATYNATTEVSIFLNNGLGNLSGNEQRYTQPGGGGREESAFADMDNDGDLDWVITNGVANSVSIRLNNGAGNFAVQAVGSPYTTTITNPTNIQLMDITGDGRIDAVVGSPNTDVNIFVNTATPTIFPAATTLVIPTTSNRPLLGDFNGDGRQDITVLQRTPGNFVVGLGNNSGTFPSLSFPNQVGLLNLNQTIADVDNDGDLDILIAADNTVQVWLNATQPRFVCTSGCGPVTYLANISPQRNVNNAVTSSLFTWQFTEPMTTATASFPTAAPPAGTDGPIRIFGNMRAGRSPNGFVGTNWTYTGATTTATLAPARALLAGEEVMVSVTSARATSGVAVRPYVYSFRTRAGVGPGQFYPRAGVPIPAAAGSGPRSIAFGDMNNDGIVDMVTAHQFSHNVTVRLGDNTGNFPTLVSMMPFPTGGNNPLQVVLADMDNDGNLDVITANAAGGANGASILLNNAGTGALSAAVGYTVGGNPNSVAVGDVDGDADLDIVVADAGSGLATVKYNNGSGAFTAAAPTFAIGTGQAFVRLSDVDNDGDLDMIVGNGGANNLTVRINDGAGSFPTTAPGSPYTAVGVTTLDMGDIDNDGDNDMVLGLSGSIVIRTNNLSASGDFSTVLATFPTTAPLQHVVFGDVNGDGNLDIIASIGNVGNAGLLVVKLGNGSGAFVDAANAPFGLQQDPRGIALADVDGDGDLDVGVAYQGAENSMGIMINGTQPRLVCASVGDCGLPIYTRAISPQRSTNTAPILPTMTWQFTEQVTAATYTSIGGTQGPIRIFGMMTGQRNIASGGVWSFAMMTTTATFQPARRFLSGEEVMMSVTSAQAPSRINAPPYVYSYRTQAGIGPAIFGNQEFSPYALGSGGQDIALGDIDGDGDADLLMATQTGIVRRLNDGTGNFTTGNAIYPTITNPTGIALGDADNDGDLDIVVCGGTNVSVLQNTAGAFTTMSGFPMTVGTNFTDVQWGDMNADGDLDIVLADQAGNRIVTMMNNTIAGTFLANAGVLTSGSPVALRITDTDNDGDFDVVVVNTAGTAGLAIMLNDGSGNLTLMPGTPITPSSGTPRGVATGDIDNDGDNDVVITTSMPDNALVYRNSFGAFTFTGTNAVATTPQDVQLGDVDGDSDLDMLVINNGANTATLWKNDGSGFFNQTAGGSPYGLGMQPRGVAFADLDGDGDLDFISANSAVGTASVMMNQGNAGLAFSVINSGGVEAFNANSRTITSRAATPFTIGSFLGRTNLSNTTATVQYSIQAASGGIGQFSIQGSTQGTINMASSMSTIATFVWRNAPVGGGSTQAVITVSPTFAGILNSTQITVTIIANPAYPQALAFSQISSTGTQGVNFGAFNQGQLLTASGRAFNLAFGAWNGWNELAATDATVRLRAFNTAGQEGSFTLNGTPTLLSALPNTATNIFSNLRIVWLNPPENAVSTQVTLRLVSEGPAALNTTNVTLTLTRSPLEPQIVSFSPTTGGTGTIVTVRGLTFSAVSGAAIAGVPVQSFTINSANQITLVAASGTSGTITLSNSFGTTESSQVFTFVEYPTILGIQPPRACAGQVLTITGTNLLDVQQVFIGSVPATSFRINDRGLLEAVVPNNADNGLVTVLNRAGTAVQAIQLVQTPVISSIQPTAIGTGGTIRVIGSNLQDVMIAALGTNPLTIQFQNSTTLTLVASTTAQVTTAPLRLESGSGCIVLSTQAISVAAPPTLTSVNTTTPEVGQTLVLTGSNFIPGMTVTLGGITAATVEVVSPFEVYATFSTNALAVAATGATLQAITPFGVATLQNNLITLRPQTVFPSNIEFTPDRGTDNTTVTITGRGFIDVRQVFFGTSPARSFRVESPERIVAIVSTGATGTVRVSSTTGTGESQRIFTYVSPQELDSIAARAFFVATNGGAWTTNANWQNPQALYRTWYGLTVPSSGAFAGRVIAINLPANGLTGSVTNAIIALSQMSALQTVNLSGNSTLGGTLGSVVAGLRSVRTLNLANTGLSGRLPLELGTLDSLQILKLDSNRLDGTLTDIFCTVFGRTQRDYSLREMRLSSNRLTGDIPPCIVQFTQLQVLRLEDNQFTGKIPEGINRLAQMREFVLARNRLTGELPRSLDSTTFVVFAGKSLGSSETQAFSQVEIFDVSSNQLSGTIPNGIAQSRGMKTLLLNNNSFTGRLPESITSLSSLETFNASQNQLSGELWDNVGAMRALKTFSVRNNRLNGIVPQSFVQISNLERLELDNNFFAGNVPQELGRAATLRVLGLSGNQLTTAPSFLGLRQTLDTLRLERNRLTFESVEPSIQIRNITYSPQDSVGEARSVFYRVGSRIPLSFSVGGAFNRYQWFRDGAAVTETQESPDFVLAQNAVASQSGVYECRITNTLVRGLTLYARPLTVRIDTAEPTNEAVLANQVAAPQLTFPYPAGRNMPYSLPLRWKSAEGASVYEVQMSLLSDFSILSTNATQTSTSLSVTSLRPGTRYYWRVRSIGAEGQRSVWSSDFFTTGTNDKPMQMTSIDFGKVSLADSVEGEALIVNFSNVAQTLQEITLEGIDNLSFKLLDDVRQLIIPAGAYIAVKVRFGPRSTGVKQATSVLRYNESLRPERIDSVINILQGTGVALKLTDIDFGIVRAGGTTIKSALLINTSPRLVTVSQVNVRDNDRIFSIETYLGNTTFSLKPNDTLSILVRCTPPSAGRKFNGVLVLGDNDAVTSSVRAEARTFKDGDVVMRFGVRPAPDSVAPGGSVGIELYGKIDVGETRDLTRALNFPRYQVRFLMNPNALIKDTTEQRATQRRYEGVPNTVFITVPLTTFDISTLTQRISANREFTLMTLKGRSVSGSTATTAIQIEQAEWSESSSNLFLEAPINGRFYARPCEAGGLRLTTSAKANSVAIARPNPVKDVAEIHYTLREDGHIAFSMIDMAGKQVQVLAEGYAEAGEYNLLLDAKTVPSGSYFLVLQTSSGIVRRRMDVVK